MQIVTTRNEERPWAWLGGGLLLCTIGGAGALVGLPLASVALLCAAKSWAPRVLSAAVVVGYGALVLAGPAQAHSVVGLVLLAVLGSIPLAVVLVQRRGWSAIPVVLLMHGRWATVAGISLAPVGGGQWGLLLLGSGFVLLPAGVVLHRHLSKLVALAQAEHEEQQVARSTSVAALSSSSCVPDPEPAAAPG